jgi:hypothetical protein
MLQETKKTHVLVKEPRMSMARLADYMAASNQAKRTIAQSCKYRAIARIIQHDEAKAVVTNHILSGAKGADGLEAKAQFIRDKLADDDFEEDVNGHNADYIERFAEVVGNITLPAGAELLPAKLFPPVTMHDVKVTFRPQLLLRRTTKTNKIKAGALMLRYAKGKSLPAKVAVWQSAGIFGYLRLQDGAEVAETERALCITLDAQTGACHEAPGNAVYLFKEMRAACATISEQWLEIKPPKGAVL